MACLCYLDAFTEADQVVERIYPCSSNAGCLWLERLWKMGRSHKSMLGYRLVLWFILQNGTKDSSNFEDLVSR